MFCTVFALGTDVDTGCWLPGTQCRRWASSYTLPVRDLDVLAQESCTKKAQTTTFRLPGLFLLYCPHGICLGYDFSLYGIILSSHLTLHTVRTCVGILVQILADESTRVSPYDVLYFVQPAQTWYVLDMTLKWWYACSHLHIDVISAPPILIYDNACNTHEYIMSRESKFMEKCSLFIDRLHMYGRVPSVSRCTQTSWC